MVKQTVKLTQEEKDWLREEKRKIRESYYMQTIGTIYAGDGKGDGYKYWGSWRMIKIIDRLNRAIK